MNFRKLSAASEIALKDGDSPLSRRLVETLADLPSAKSVNFNPIS